MANQQGFPQIGSPFVDPLTGRIQQAWYQLLVALWSRTGGGGGSDITVIIQLLEEIAAELAALTVQSLTTANTASGAETADALAALSILTTQRTPVLGDPEGLTGLFEAAPVPSEACGPDLLTLARSIFAGGLMNAVTISISGDATGSAQFDGHGDVDIPVTVSGGGGGASGTADATEALSAGDLCNVYSVAGVASIQRADATDDTKPANAYVTAAVLMGASATWFGPAQIDTAVSGLTPGETYYLDTTPGGVTATPPSSSGNLVQKVGFAKSATELVFFPSDGVTL